MYTYYFSTQGCKGLRLCVSLEDEVVPLLSVCASFGLAGAPFRNASMLCSTFLKMFYLPIEQ